MLRVNSSGLKKDLIIRTRLSREKSGKDSLCKLWGMGHKKIVTLIFDIVWSSLTTSAIISCARILACNKNSWFAWTLGIVKWVSSFGFFFTFLGGWPTMTVSSLMSGVACRTLILERVCMWGSALRGLFTTRFFPCFVFMLLWMTLREFGAFCVRGIVV